MTLKMSGTNTAVMVAATGHVEEELINVIMKHILLNGTILKLNGRNLRQFPAQHLNPYAHITKIDLSFNRIQVLSDEFPIQFPRLKILTLKNNELKKLSSNIGCLTHLTHLDLSNNELVHLPMDIHRLKLVWLDLKLNPLEEDLSIACGGCRDDKECKECARKVIQFYASMAENVGRKTAPPHENTFPDEVFAGPYEVQSRQSHAKPSKAVMEPQSQNLAGDDVQVGMKSLEIIVHGSWEGDMGVQIAPRSQTHINRKCLAISENSSKSMLGRVAIGTEAQRNTVTRCLIHLISILIQLLVISIIAALFVDYRVVRGRIDYHLSAVLSKRALAYIAEYQMLVQSHVIAVTRMFTQCFPFIRYLDPAPGYVEIIYEYIRWVLCPVTALFGFRCA